MAGSLSMFFSQNAEKVENQKYVASERFKDENGNPIEWEIQAITPDEDEALRRSCTKRVPVPGKKNLYQPETDYNKYLGLLAVKCVVYPNLQDAALQDSYKVLGADVLLKTMLLMGEYNDLLSKIQEVNGFDRDINDKIEEAKN